MTIINRGGAETWWKVKLPPQVKYMERNNPYEEWRSVTWKEIFVERKKKQESKLFHKRRKNVNVTKPAFVWVFHNATNFFGGWYIYIKTLKEDYAINFRARDSNNIMEKAMNLFPCGVIPVKENFERWAESFSMQFAHVGFKRKRNQGLVKVLCKIDNRGNIIDLLA